MNLSHSPQNPHDRDMGLETQSARAPRSRPEELTENDEVSGRVESVLSREGLNERAMQKLRGFFESPQSGYSYGFSVLNGTQVDPRLQRPGDTPVPTAEQAWETLRENVTQAQFEIIISHYRKPVIVLEPVVAHRRVLQKRIEEESKNDLRQVGKTYFYLTPSAANNLDQLQDQDDITSLDEKRILSWRVGIVDAAQVPPLLETDGNVTQKSVEERLNDFQETYGSMGFESTRPTVYGLLQNASGSQGGFNRLDPSEVHPPQARIRTILGGQKNVQGTTVIAFGYWNADIDSGVLNAQSAMSINPEARIRLALMFPQKKK